MATDFQSVALPVELPGRKGPDVAQAGRATQEEVESWRSVVGYAAYEVSSLGRVRRATGGPGAKVGAVLRGQIGTHGYLNVNLSGGTRGSQRRLDVHILVARAFLGPVPAGMEVDHANRNRADARLSNLRYITRLENNANKGPHRCGACGKTGHRRPACPRPGAQRTSDRRRQYYLAYLSCGLTPAEAREFQRQNLRRARVQAEAARAAVRA